MAFQIECEVGKLLKAAQTILPAVSGRSSLPILKHILMEASDDGSLRLMGTDMEMGIRSSLTANIKESGKATAEAKMLTALLSKLPQHATVSLQQVGNESIKALCNKSLYAIYGQNAEEYPVWHSVKDGEKLACFELSGTDFAGMIKQVEYATSDDKARAMLTGIHLRLVADTLTLVATDTHRLARKTASVTRSDGEGLITLPKPFFSAVAGYLEKEPTISCEFSDGCIWTSLSNAAVEVYSKTLAGQYPNYQRIIPSSHTSMISFSVQEMKDAAERAMLVAIDNLNRLTLSPSGMFLEITAHAVGQTAREEIVCSMEAEPPQFIMNGKYLLDSLNSLKGETAQIELMDALKPTVLFDTTGTERDASLLVILMPMNAEG